ncbi:unnamed protein product [marine sediment metagenome]|uniref:Uncharacterized protein n=1 Tax=marine sediment metagenome TaxID=412755 RepID=X0WQ34_9ZZZZ
MIASCEGKFIKFYCDNCDLVWEYIISEFEDNKVTSISVQCDDCKSMRRVNLLRCSDESLADLLNERFIVMKSKY